MKRRASAVGVALAAGLLCAVQDGAAAGESALLGAEAYKRHCAQCHGERADGRGMLADRYDPRPSNLAESTRSDDYRSQIITVGGKAMGRSNVMPQWGLELSDQEISALVSYLRKVSNDAAVSRRAAATRQ